MRLTLRTLLAYRDNVLDGKDTHALEQRLRDSATARSISERIDGAVANSRLSPIPVDAREFGWDPNHVASFLDDTMTADRLPDMERTCLENSSLLAEVASCHQILARAIAIPVQVSPAFRDRIGGLLSKKKVRDANPRSEESGHAERIVRSDASHPSIPQPNLLASSTRQAPTPTMETREELQTSLPQGRRPNKNLGGSGIELVDHLGTQVPEYLRGTDRQWLASTIKLLVLISLLGVCVANAMRPWDRLQRLLDRTPRRFVVPTPVHESSSVMPELDASELDASKVGSGEEVLERVPDSIIVSPTPEERNQ